MTVGQFSDLLVAMSGFAWPAAGIAIAVLFRKFIGQMLSRENVTIKIAGMEVSAAEAAKQTGASLTDLVERMAQIEDRLANVVPEETHRPRSETRAETAILWVDDYPENNAFLIQKFQEEGMQVVTALSTQEGLARLSERSFNILISDLGRRENGVENAFAGVDLVRAVRASGNGIPILIFAGARGLSNAERLRSAGADMITASTVDVFRFVNEHRAS